jgi:hypothetical protein
VTISSIDPFWSALAAHDLGSQPAPSATTGAATGAGAAAAGATPSSTSAQAKATTLLSLLGGTTSSPGTPSASGAFSELLDGQPSGAAGAVSAAVDNAILDVML